MCEMLIEALGLCPIKAICTYVIFLVTLNMEQIIITYHFYIVKTNVYLLLVALGLQIRKECGQYGRVDVQLMQSNNALLAVASPAR